MAFASRSAQNSRGSSDRRCNTHGNQVQGLGRILFVGRNYAPEPTGIGPLSADLCEHLAEQGWAVDVLAAVPHYPEWRAYPGYRAARIPIEQPAIGLMVRRLPIYLRGKPSGARARILYDLSFAWGAFRRALVMTRPDAVICVAPPLLAALGAALVAKRHQVPLVLIVQDLELQIASQLGALREGPSLRIARGIERFVCGRASTICVISETFATYLRGIGVPDRKLQVIPNWVDTDFIRPLPRGSYLADACGFASDAAVALYAGNMGEKQGLETVIHAAAALQEQGIQLVLVGDGSARKGLQTLAGRLGVDNVHFLPLQPRASMPEMLSGADVLLLVQRPEVVDSVVPSKLLTYMAAGRPILAAVASTSETAAHLRSARCGIVCTHDGLSQCLRALLSDSGERQQMATSGRDYCQAAFSRASVLSRFVHLVADAGCRASSG